MGFRSKVVIFIFISSILLYKYSQRKLMRRPSELLQHAVDETLYFSDTMEKMLEFLQETTKFDELIKNHVKPGVDKLASLRAQTGKYEEMIGRTGSSGAPGGGGPTHFISTSLESLHEMQNNILDWESSYRLATHRIKSKWPKLEQEIDRVQERMSFLHSDGFFEPLDSFQIHLQPMDYVDDGMAASAAAATKKPLPIPTILKIIQTEIIPPVKQFEELKIKNGLAPILEGSKDFNMQMDPAMLKILTELTPLIKKYGGQLNTLGVYWTKILKDLKEMSSNALEKAEKCKLMYEELAIGMDTDVTKLKERIKNLNTPKTKFEL